MHISTIINGSNINNYNNTDLSIDQFDKCQTIFKINFENTIYFKYLSYNVASYIYSNILFNKIYPITICCLCLMIFTVGGIYERLSYDITAGILYTQSEI